MISWCSTWHCTWHAPPRFPPPAQALLHHLAGFADRTAVLAVACQRQTCVGAQADIANALKPKAVYIEWTRRVLSEFFAQVC